MLSPMLAVRTYGKDTRGLCQDSRAEWRTAASPSEGPEWRGIEPCRFHLFLFSATKCRHVGSHVARCRQGSATDWSQANTLSAAIKGVGSRHPAACQTCLHNSKRPAVAVDLAGQYRDSLAQWSEALLHAPVRNGAGPNPPGAATDVVAPLPCVNPLARFCARLPRWFHPAIRGRGFRRQSARTRVRSTQLSSHVPAQHRAQRR